jgi:hypothetical protein
VTHGTISFASHSLGVRRFGEASHKFGDKVADMTCLPDNLDTPSYYQNQSFEQPLRSPRRNP